MRDCNDQMKLEHEQEEYIAEQSALPPHKRDGYAERIYEMADDLRDRLKFEALFNEVTK